MKTITQEELNERIRLHGLWLAKDPAGIRLDLSFHDLSNKNFREADCRGADFRCANFQDAYLVDADCRGAYLWDAIGNGKEIQTLQTPEWHVNIVHPTKTIWVGCKSIRFDDFFALTKAKAEKIYVDSWDWVKIWRPAIEKIIKEGNNENKT